MTKTQRAALSVSFLSLTLSACGGPVFDGDLADPVVEDDLAFAPMPDPEAPFEAMATAPQVLFLNFDGGVIRGCPSTNRYCSDATTNRSWLVNNAGLSQVTLAAYALSDRASVTSSVRQLYAPYNVTVTTTRPASGTYTMIMISNGSSSFIGSVGTYGYRGQAPLDCTNANRNDIGFLFTNRIGGSSLANGAAHEAAHSFGLVHITPANDVMLATNPGSLWQTGPINGSNFCRRANNQQSDPAVLAATVGVK